jgi:hypothetical protein
LPHDLWLFSNDGFKRPRVGLVEIISVCQACNLVREKDADRVPIDIVASFRAISRNSEITREKE